MDWEITRTKNNNEEEPGDDQEFMNESQMVGFNKNKGGNVKDTAKNNNNNKNKSKKNSDMIGYQENDGKFCFNIFNLDDTGENPKLMNSINKGENEASCGFCGFFDPNFDENSLYMHCFKECPMVRRLI